METKNTKSYLAKLLDQKSVIETSIKRLRDKRFVIKNPFIFTKLKEINLEILKYS